VTDIDNESGNPGQPICSYAVLISVPIRVQALPCLLLGTQFERVSELLGVTRHQPCFGVRLWLSSCSRLALLLSPRMSASAYLNINGSVNGVPSSNAGVCFDLAIRRLTLLSRLLAWWLLSSIVFVPDVCVLYLRSLSSAVLFFCPDSSCRG
jgi:hypothetical protein